MQFGFKALFISLFGLSFLTQADPYTDILLGKDVDNFTINEYYKKHYIEDKESLVVIGSHYKKSEMPIAGTGFTIESNDRKFIITNSHLIDGDNKFYIYQGQLYPIQEANTLSCANHDVAVIEVNDEIKETFGKYDQNKDSLYTYGKNNSPRGQQKSEFDFGEKRKRNNNNRPLFENSLTGEILSYVQIGNMYDLSCNFYPSSPEAYKGNALFVPISEAIKAITTEAIPYKQNHHNQIGKMNSILDLIAHNECRINLDSKEKEHEKSRQSFLSRSIITPSSIVPGMSGSPLLQNNNLTQSKYQIAGIATSYDRIMQKSIFASHSNIKYCLKNYLNEKRGHLDSVRFKYSKKYKSTYRQKKSERLIEEIPNTHGKANGDLTETKIKELYDLYLEKKKELNVTEDNRSNLQTIEILQNFKGKNIDQTIIRGGNGYGNGGGPLADNSLEFRERIIIPTGISVEGDLVIGFKCLNPNKKNEDNYIFANWEGLSYSENNQCREINTNEKIDLTKLLKNRVKNLKSDKDQNTEETFSIGSVIKLKNDKVILTVTGKKNKKKFKKSVVINNDIKSFRPRVEINLDEEHIIIADIKELFFIDMLNISRTSKNQRIEDAIQKDSKARVFYSLKKKGSNKGSIPLINTWK
ncbi:trypsin-like peptidase domain-containing protein [Halobacteriovorax sp. DA5]|uniref:trypsin-like peptidase domain-containing protein n=1 Tax=Halobacteriovorax sp. DA5 TaxID=2067553 RepID=UPI000CD02FD3|nr:trypsin-like peptidase domain-containing protein [Halobacteriovorax sp. DA5]POB14596.1 hypothetical protein C0Z22_05740 [Halobacteriovorax sp. DA5]